MKEFWLPTILAALLVIAALLGGLLYFQQQERASQALCAQGKAWGCPHPLP
ncbi:MAG TPA: hypothetical protein VIG69_10400 [Candidatus Methylomirabilis sp.]